MSRAVLSRVTVVVVCLVALARGAAAFDGPEVVDGLEKRAAILKTLEAIPEFQKEVEHKKFVLSTTLRYQGRPQSPDKGQTFLKVLLYRYDDGKTIRVVYNETKKKLTKLELLEAYPTPPGDAEVKLAEELAKTQSDKVKDLFRRHAEVSVRISPAIVSDRNDERFRKRLLTVFFTPKERGSGTTSVTVNLTDESTSDD